MSWTRSRSRCGPSLRISSNGTASRRSMPRGCSLWKRVAPIRGGRQRAGALSMSTRFNRVFILFNRVYARLDRVSTRFNRVRIRLDRVSTRCNRARIRFNRVSIRLNRGTRPPPPDAWRSH